MPRRIREVVSISTNPQYVDATRRCIDDWRSFRCNGCRRINIKKVPADYVIETTRRIRADVEIINPDIGWVYSKRLVSHVLYRRRHQFRLLPVAAAAEEATHVVLMAPLGRELDFRGVRIEQGKDWRCRSCRQIARAEHMEYLLRDDLPSGKVWADCGALYTTTDIADSIDWSQFKKIKLERWPVRTSRPD